jgi:hypothetical protein
VLLSLERYEQLLEDLHDLAVIAERRDEGTITLEELKKRLQNEAVNSVFGLRKLRARPTV